MSASVQFLANELIDRSARALDEERYYRLESNVQYLNDLNPEFTSIAAGLISTPDESESKEAADLLRLWLTDETGVPAAHKQAAGQQKKYRSTADVVVFILSYVIRSLSFNRIRVYGEADNSEQYSYVFLMHKISIQGMRGDDVAKCHNLTPRPNLLKASRSEVDNYFHPLAVAATLLDVRDDEEQFIRQLPAFMEWIATKQDMDAALLQALAVNSADPSTIEAISKMRETTAVPLYSGLI